jgi:putative transposase
MNDSRWIWNWALGQRLNFQNLGSSISYVDQAAIFTNIKNTEPCHFLSNMPRNIADHILRDLDLAWQRSKNKNLDFNKPKFKKKFVDEITSLTEPSISCFQIGNNWIKFPKIKEKIRCNMHRKMIGTPCKINISLDVDKWYVCITNSIDSSIKVHPNQGTSVGLDRGVVNVLADSNGILIPNPRFGKKMSEKITRHQKNLSRKVKGSKNYIKEKNKLAKDHQKVRYQRKDHNDKLTHSYSKNHEIIVVEDLKVKDMTSSSKKKTAQSAVKTESGRVTKIAYKAALNAAILDVGWGQIKTMLEYKTRKFGGQLFKVNPAYSSQECSECDHIDENNRKSQSLFCCTKCGHSENADTNGAKVILKRYFRLLAEQNSRRSVGEAVCGGALSAPKKQKLFVVKRKLSKVSDT